MLRALVTAFCAVSLTYSLAQSKRTTDTRIPTVSIAPTGPTDGSLSPDARFAIAAANTTVLYSASFNLGASCAEQGWTTVDATAQPGTFWHVDDFAGANVDVGDSYAPLAGAKSLWCGARAASSGDLCLYAVLPGYGDGWHQAWRTKTCLAVSGDLDVSFLMRVDSEPQYDAAFLEYTDQCGAEYRDASWALLAGGTGVWDGVQNISHAASYDVGPGPVEVRIRFASDGTYSDEDGDFDSHGGPVIIDDLDVEGLALEDFEDEAVGATSSDDWEADLFPGFGDYFALFSGASLLQEDVCAKNLSCAWAAIASSTDTYACGGHPEQIAVPTGLGNGGLYIDNSIQSPPIPLTGSGSRVNLQFSVYRDLAISRGVVYTWAVRGLENGCPDPWGSRNTVYFGDQKDWKVDVFAIEDLIDLSASTHVQVRLGVFDRCIVSCGFTTTGDCHSHAPLFDTVKVYRVDVGGPTFVVDDFDMFQDTFPADGSATGIGRADMARSITAAASPTIQPGDSCVLICKDPLTAVSPSNPTGLADDLALGGKQVYAWVHVIDSGVPSVTKTGAALTDDPVRYPFKDTQVADGKTWTRIRCDLAQASVGRFRVDLHDNLFEAGDVIEFFFGATNTLGETNYCSGSALDYVQSDASVAAAAASEFTILPLDGFTGILYVDGMDGRGGQVFWDTAFGQIGFEPDRYDVRGPASAVANRPSTRVTDVTTQLNGHYRKILWDCGDLSVGL
ncbi:MAG TPA: hypothetical protein VEC56_09245, partial [Candidatus Krumholzibacteria bacterium]|nr:hypothetical protein [Candidatus Krumholzibacteria bacterium]